MSQIEDGQVGGASLTPSVYVLPQRIEFHLSKKSSFSFSGSTFKPQSASVSEFSGHLHSNFENGMGCDYKSPTIVRRIGAGLDNLGNTCFLNSVLQCLTYTEPLVAYLQSGKHQNSCRVVGFCALCSIQKHVTRALQATGRVLAPKDLVSNLRCLSRNFRNARQEDAHEFMVHLLESMHKCCLPSGVPSESSSAYEKSFVHKIFGGCLRSQVKCMQCSYSSDKFDPFLDLSLEIVKADSLQKALMRFTAQEQLDGGERRYQCQQCKQKVQALKQLTIEKAPYVLTIHLKRFGSHISGQKIDKKVQFGPTLNLKPFVSGSYDGDVKYTLYGVLVHAGWNTHSGHYYCFVRTSSGMWYSLDDSRVVQVSERTVMDQKAYMLFYLRDRNTSSPENIANAVQKHKIVPTSTLNGSCSIPATSQVLENRCTPRPTSAVLDKAIRTAVENGTGSIAATCQGSQDKSANKSVNSVQKVKTMTSVMQNGSCATDTVSQIFPKGVVAKSSECPTDVATVPRNSDKAGSALEELASKKKLDSESGLSKSNSRLVGTDGLTSDAFRIPFRQKLKKKVLVYRVASTHLSTRMLYVASLNLQKRKKHKKAKRRIQQVAAINIVDEQMGPSTSDVRSANTVHGSSSPKKGSECGARKRGSDAAASDVPKNEISVDGSCGSELSIRIASGDTMPTGDDQSLKSPKMPTTSKNQQDKQPSDLNGKVNVDNGIAVNPSRNFKHTTVGRWDDIELPFSQNVDADNTNTVSIGYVADEWDEEYDRGKRKKVRMSTISFGGPNPFQEVATMAAKSKDRSKRCNPVNQPFNL